jgi:CHAT domain-containing protein
VDDSSTDLMIDFYRFLDGSPASALFRARYHLLEQHMHPIQLNNSTLSARDVESLDVSLRASQKK